MQTQTNEKVKTLVNLLENHFGEPEWNGKGKPLDSLIKTILSQSTNDQNRDRAFKTLVAKFPNWESVMFATTEDIAAAIRPAGLSNQKSERIKHILMWIYQQYGSLDLDFLCDMDPVDATKTFMQLKGIGIKTISVVLMFTCGVDVFPVDTHVHRICRRTGLVPENFSAEKTHWQMQPQVPAGKSYSLHMNFLRLGRTICKARNPQCVQCPILDLCDFGQNNKRKEE